MIHNTKIKTAQIEVTPQQAIHWLEKNTHNRPLTQSAVDRYARDMATGRWTFNHQGIAIADDHTIIDGQHRLWAVIESKTTIPMMVTTGLHISVQDSIDGGLVRSARDVLVLREGAKVENLHLGIARILARQCGAEIPTRGEVIDCYKLHQAKVDQSVQLFPHRARHIRTATVLTVFARSLYTQDASDVARFARILSDGLRSDDEDEPQRRDDNALLLRKFLRGETTQRCLRPTVPEAYFKTERALRAYLDGDRLKTLYAANEEMFPLPSEGKVIPAHIRRAQLQRAALKKKTA